MNNLLSWYFCTPVNDKVELLSFENFLWLTLKSFNEKETLSIWCKTFYRVFLNSFNSISNLIQSKFKGLWFIKILISIYHQKWMFSCSVFLISKAEIFLKIFRLKFVISMLIPKTFATEFQTIFQAYIQNIIPSDNHYNILNCISSEQFTKKRKNISFFLAFQVSLTLWQPR